MDRTAKARMQRYRNKNRNITVDSVTKDDKALRPDVTQYPAIVHALVDPIKREKLIRVCCSLKSAGQLENVKYGVLGISMGYVSDLIEATEPSGRKLRVLSG